MFFFFTNFTKCCRSKKVGIIIYYIGKVFILTGQSEKGYSAFAGSGSLLLMRGFQIFAKRN